MSRWPPRSPAQRFWSHVDKTENCWLWTASVDSHGYGQFSDRTGHRVSAHRYVFDLVGSHAPSGLDICHTCDNPRCVNPAHLFSGTATANIRDGARKGRYGSWKTKLSDEMFAQILEAVGLPKRELAHRFGVSQETVSRIRRGIQRRNQSNWRPNTKHPTNDLTFAAASLGPSIQLPFRGEVR